MTNIPAADVPPRSTLGVLRVSPPGDSHSMHSEPELTANDGEARAHEFVNFTVCLVPYRPSYITRVLHQILSELRRICAKSKSLKKLKNPAFAKRSSGSLTVGFSSPAPVPPNSHVRVYYDIAENGGLREIAGIPQLTHTTTRQGRPGRSYHYRLSHWIVAPSVMRIIPPQYAAGLTARRASGVRSVPQSDRQVEGLSVIDKTGL
jgi:hypothetical protein